MRARADRTACLLVMVSVGCGGDQATPPTVGNTPRVAAIHIDAPTTSLVVGEVVVFEARAVDSAGAQLPISSFLWGSSNSTVATVDRGFVQAMAPGATTISAIARGVSGRLPIGVLGQLPVITNIEPQSVAAGEPAIVNVIGRSFYRGSVVRLNGNGKTTTFLNVTELRASFTAADLAIPGAYKVTVLNSQPGGGLSNAVDFIVQ